MAYLFRFSKLDGIYYTDFKIIKPSWRYVGFNKYYQATYPVYMNWLYWHTNRLLGKDSSNLVSAMHKISIFPSTILSKSPDLFLMEMIFRYEKINLLRWNIVIVSKQHCYSPRILD